ncbi:MAG: proline--tRNA ligase [Chloroflexota bacterium]
MSQLFGNTLRQNPADAEMPSHQLLVRAGMIRPLAAGIYSYLPLGWRVLRNIETIMRQEMEAIGAQEMMMPFVQPAELWQATGRWQSIGADMARFQDRAHRDLVLAMTHEEAVAQLARTEIRSYRHLPRLIYHIQAKFRDEPRPRGGLIRVREFTMKDAYSLDADADGLDVAYRNMHRAYERIFQRCGIQALAVQADVGQMGGSASEEFMALNEHGEDTLILCPACGYAANVEWASFARPEPPCPPEAEIQEIATPHCKTIADLAAFVGLPRHQTLKAVFYVTQDGEFIFAVIRGDLDVNEIKLRNLLGGVAFGPATEAEIRGAGAEPGYGSPVGLRGVRVIADDSVRLGRNFVAGANKEGYHLLNVNYPRDFEAAVVGDFALARAGDACPNCGQPLTERRGIELGHLFKLGSRYSQALGATYLDADGQARPIVMGSYGIGTGRLMAAIVEQHHDQHGIVWPVEIAPYQVHLINLGHEPEEETSRAADRLYAELQQQGFQVLYDERNERPGVKFNDADLIGAPLRVTVGQRNLAQNGVEVKRRDADEGSVVSLSELPASLRCQLNG